jgi:hypothetical protein
VFLHGASVEGRGAYSKGKVAEFRPRNIRGPAAVELARLEKILVVADHASSLSPAAAALKSYTAGNGATMIPSARLMPIRSAGLTLGCLSSQRK